MFTCIKSLKNALAIVVALLVVLCLSLPSMFANSAIVHPPPYPQRRWLNATSVPFLWPLPAEFFKSAQ